MSNSEADGVTVAGKLAPGGLMIGSLLGALLAALLLVQLDSWLVLEVELPNQPNDEQLAVYNAALTAFELKQGVIQFGAIGLLIGLCGGAGSYAAARAKAAVTGGVAGCLLGVVSGYLGATLLGYFDQFRDVPPVLMGITFEPLMQAAVCQLACWTLLGAGVGFGVGVGGVGLKHGLTAAAGGLLGGVLTTLLFTLISSFAFPDSNFMLLVPRSFSEKLVWSLLAGASLAGCIYLSVQPKKASAKESEAAAEAAS